MPKKRVSFESFYSVMHGQKTSNFILLDNGYRPLRNFPKYIISVWL